MSISYDQVFLSMRYWNKDFLVRIAMAIYKIADKFRTAIDDFLMIGGNHF